MEPLPHTFLADSEQQLSRARVRAKHLSMSESPPAVSKAATPDSATPSPVPQQIDGGHHDPHDMRSKKRKATYLVRKEEAAALKAQVEALQRQVTELKLYGPRVPAAFRGEASLLEDVLGANGLLSDIVQQQHATIASAQSMLTQYQEAQSTHPLYSYVHLPESWDERRQVLLCLKEDKFTRGCKYILARSQQMNLLKRHSSDNRYEDEDGNFCCERFQVRQIKGAKSVRQAFDAAIFAQSSMEISVSEKLGHLTVRDDYDSVEGDASISNFHLVSNGPDGLAYEASKIVCAEYFSEREGGGNSPCAVMTVDFVDKDDRYPYKPEKYVRKDVSAVIVLTEEKNKKPKSLRAAAKEPFGCDVKGPSGITSSGESADEKEDEEELVVVMQHVAFIKIHKPAFEVSAHALQALEEDITSWGDVIVQSAKGFVDAPV